MRRQVSGVRCQVSDVGRAAVNGPHRTARRLFLTPDTRHPTPIRSGLTLIELLITITIIAILAGMILGVASVAGETAREAHTRHMVTRLHTLLMQHLDTYKTRRVKLNPIVEALIQNSLPAARRGPALAEARLYAMREMMLMEIPDRWSDITLDAVPGTIKDPMYLDMSGTTVGNRRTELANVYMRRYQSLLNRINSQTNQTNTPEEIQNNQGAECLYLVITIACGDGEARTLFHESNIGDSDGDGAPEFLDGWGHPINFLRWAPGFDSEIQINANLYATANALIEAAKSDHDPFDLFRSQPNAFRLVPLIYSPGRDEDSGLHSNEDYVTWRPTTPSVVQIQSNSTPPYLRPQLDPYLKNPDYLGTDNGAETATDNIHNHMLGER